MTLVGQTLDDRYEVLGVVGEGGMGIVYKGRHVGLGRHVAIKVLAADFMEDDQAARRFTQEAQIAGNLGHPNICEVTDVGTTEDDLPYMVMPFLEGHTLADEVTDLKGRLPSSRAIDIIAQILSALHTAHANDIVHRDLKPENIFLTTAGDRKDFVKILDFGISKVVGTGGKKLQRLTSTGMVLGTPYYMAPEQASGAKDLDQRVDVYAVGALLYEALTGHTPHEADSYNEIIIKIVNDDPPEPRTLNPTISRRLEQVVLKAMEKNRDARFQTVGEFRQALLEAGEQSGITLPLSVSQSHELPKETLSSAAAEVSDAVPTVSMRVQTEGRRSVSWLWIVVGTAAMGLVILGVVLLGSGGSDTQKQAAPDPSATANQRLATESLDAMAKRPSPKTTAVIKFLGLPKGGKLTLGDRPVKGNTVTLPRTDFRMRYRAEAPGHKPQEGWITPDQDRQVLITLTKIPKPDAGTPSAMGAGAMTTPMVRGPGLIWGRHGARVKTNYDAED